MLTAVSKAGLLSKAEKAGLLSALEKQVILLCVRNKEFLKRGQPKTFHIFQARPIPQTRFQS